MSFFECCIYLPQCINQSSKWNHFCWSKQLLVLSMISSHRVLLRFQLSCQSNNALLVAWRRKSLYQSRLWLFQNMTATFIPPASVQLPLSCRVSSCANVLNWTRVSLPGSSCFRWWSIGLLRYTHALVIVHTFTPTAPSLYFLTFYFPSDINFSPLVCSTAWCTLPE